MEASQLTANSVDDQEQRLAPLASEQAGQEPQPSIDLTQDERGLFSLTGLASVEFSVDYLSSFAGFENSHGFYLADADGRPIGGQIIAAKVKGASEKTITLDLSDESAATSLGFFIVPDGGTQNLELADGDEVSFELIDGIWTPTLAGEPLTGIGAPAFFTDVTLNPDGIAHSQDSQVEGNQNWEDILDGGDQDFGDVNLNLAVKGQPKPPEEPQPSIDLTQDERGLFSLTGLASVEFSVDYLSSFADFENSHGFYLADADGRPIGGQIIAAKVKGASEKTITLDLSDESAATSLGFFIVPDGGTQNPELADGDEVSFELIDGIWTPTLAGEPLTGIGAPAFFTDVTLNPDGIAHSQDSQVEGNQNWEDILDGGDQDFGDVNLNLAVKGQPKPPEEPQPSIDLTQDERGLFSLTGLASVEFSVDYLSSFADFENSHGFYLADADGRPIGGQIIAAKVKGASEKTITLDLSDESAATSLGFFIVPDGGTQNLELADGDEVSFELIDGIWTPTLAGEPLTGIGAPAFFTDVTLNPDGIAHSQDSQVEGSQNWEDILDGGDQDFGDVNLNLAVKGQPIGSNNPPVASDDEGDGYRTNESTSFVTASVLDNDSDLDGDTLSVIALNTSGTIGEVSDNGDGTFNYDPNGQFNDLTAGETATDTFEYTVSDGKGGISTATVTVTIEGQDASNQAPEATADDGEGFGTNESTGFVTASVLSNDSDPDGDPLSVVALNTIGTTGQVSYNGDGTFTYNPNGQFDSLGADETATDTFEYTVSDGKGGTSTATVTVTIEGQDASNQAPEATADDGEGFGTNESTGFVTASVLENDSDPDGDPLSVVALNTIGTTGQVSYNGDGTFTYNPNGQFDSLGADETATDTFEYTVSDAKGGTSTATVTVTIEGQDASNQAPEATADDGEGFGTNESTGFVTASVLENDSDPDGDPLSVVALDTTGTTGQVSDNGDGTFIYDPDGQFNNLAAGETATDTFEYTVSDGNGGTSTATVSVTIEGQDNPNQAPIAANDSGEGFGTNESTSFVTASVLDNDSDPDGDTLSVIALDTTETTGEVSDNGDGTFTYNPNGQFENLAAGETATDTFQYSVSDGGGETSTAAVTVTIRGRSEVVQATAIWDDPAGGDWRDAGKWRDGDIPISDDGVLIILDEDAVVTNPLAQTDVQGLRLDGKLELIGTEFSADVAQVDSGELVLRSGATIANTEIIAEGTGQVRAVSGRLENVIVDTDIVIQNETSPSSGSTLTIESGSTIHGSIVVDGETDSISSLDLLGQQTLDGTGEIQLLSKTDSTNGRVNFIGQQFNEKELMTFGEGITIRGSGYIVPSRSEDALRILGNVIAEDGLLRIHNIDNGGSTISLAEANDGELLIVGGLSDADASVAEGSTVEIRNVIDRVSLDGPGTAAFGRSTDIRGLEIKNGSYSAIDVLGGGAYGYAATTSSIYGDLVIDGQFSVAGGEATAATLRFRGAQEVGGAGTIVLSQQNAIDDGSVRNFVNFLGFHSGSERLTFGEDLTISGNGEISASLSNDEIQILGTVSSIDGGRLELADINNQGEVLTVNAENGSVAIDGLVSDTVFEGADGQPGRLDILSGTYLDNVTLGIDASFDAPSSSRTIFITDGLTLDADLEVAAASSGFADLSFRGAQEVDGVGTILLSRDSVLDDTAARNFITLNGLQNASETLIFGSGITLAGDGTINASSSRDSIQILGTVQGIEDGTLSIARIDNEGQSFAVDASLGTVVLNNVIENAVINEVDGQTGRLELASANLENVTFNVDTVLDAGSTSRSASISNGLTVNETLTLAGSSSRFASFNFFGEQTVDGSGDIVLGRENSLGNNPVFNSLSFSGESSLTETLTIGADLTIRGQGSFTGVSSSDQVDLKGTVRAEDGELQIRRFDDLDGTLGASSNGILQVQEDLDMLEQGTLEIGVDQSGTGRIEISGSLDRAGVLALNVANDFDANLGDTFEIVTASTELTGSFQGFEGFDLVGDLAFVIDEADGALSLRVATDAEAQAQGVFNSFDAPPPPPPPGPSEIKLDRIEGLIANSIITDSESELPEIEAVSATLRNVSLQEDVRLSAENSSPILTIEKGLVVDAQVSVAGAESRSASLSFRGEQAVSGSGTILLDRSNATDDGSVRNFVDFRGLHSGTERLTFGEELTISGDGEISASLSNDEIQILGTVSSIDGGRLELANINNQGEVLTVNAENGSVAIDGLVSDTIFEGAVGQTGRLDILSGTYLDNVTLGIDASFDGAPSSGRTIFITDGLTLDADLEVAAASSGFADLSFQGTQEVDGVGTILLSRTNALDGTAARNFITLNGLQNASETLIFGSGITLAGDGTINASSSRDSIQILGTVQGIEDGTLSIARIDNEGQSFAVDASLGTVVLNNVIENAVINEVDGQTGRLELASANLENVTFNVDTVLDAGSTSRSASISDGVTVNDTLTLAGSSSRSASVNFVGEQTIDGSGDIVLGRENALDENPVFNFLSFLGQSNLVDTLTVGQDLTVRGQGSFTANSSNDRIDVKGTVRAEDGELQIRRFDDLDGTLGASANGILEVQEDLNMLEQGTLEIGIDQSGAGRIEISGSLDRAGKLALDVSDDFSGELGDTFEFLTTTSGVEGTFDSFEGFDLAGDLAFVLTEDDGDLGLRVATDAEAQLRGFLPDPLSALSDDNLF